MKILMVTHYFKPHIGGIEIVAYNQAKELVKKGHEVTILTSKLHGDNDLEVIEGIRVVRVHAWNLFEKKFGVPYPLFSARLLTTMYHEVKKHDIIHAHGVLYAGSFLSSLVAKLCKKPFLITEHVGFVAYENPLINVVEKLALNTIGRLTLWASNTTIVLNATVHQWIACYQKEVQFLPNGVDLGLFHRPTAQEKQAIRAHYDIPLDTFIVLFVGRFVAKKGFEVLYNAKDPSYQLVFVGGGNASPDTLQSDASVRMLGTLSQEDVALLYKASDVFILPSYGEGFPLSIQEAMATGLPIITSKQNNLDHILDSPFVSYIDIHETEIRSAIKKIQDDRVLRKKMGEYSSKIARENYSWEKNSAALVDIYCRTSLAFTKDVPPHG
jgi:D-inositol-3-phosphate glycosyltransferase